QHSKIASLWASRVPNIGPPKLSIEKGNSLPASMKSVLPMAATETDWKFIDRARNWALQSESGTTIPIKAKKLGDTRMIELDLGPAIKPGSYSLVANWDWDRFQPKGHIEVKPLGDFASARLIASSQDLLVSKTGK